MTEQVPEYNVANQDGCNAEAGAPKKRLLAVPVPRLMPTNELARVNIGSLIPPPSKERDVYRCCNCNAPHVLPDDVERHLVDLKHLMFAHDQVIAERDGLRSIVDSYYRRDESRRLEKQLEEQRLVADGFLEEVRRLERELDEQMQVAHVFQDKARQLEEQLGNPGVAGLNVKSDTRSMNDVVSAMPPFFSQVVFADRGPSHREQVLEFALGLMIDNGVLDHDMVQACARMAESYLAKEDTRNPVST